MNRVIKGTWAGPCETSAYYGATLSADDHPGDTNPAIEFSATP